MNRNLGSSPLVFIISAGLVYILGSFEPVLVDAMRVGSSTYWWTKLRQNNFRIYSEQTHLRGQTLKITQSVLVPASPWAPSLLHLRNSDPFMFPLQSFFISVSISCYWIQSLGWAFQLFFSFPFFSFWSSWTEKGLSPNRAKEVKLPKQSHLHLPQDCFFKSSFGPFI